MTIQSTVNVLLLIKWIKELRSGKYKQTQMKLCRIIDINGDKGYCCLGVLGCVYDSYKKVDSWKKNNNIWLYEDGGTKLPDEIFDELHIPLLQETLIDWNDHLQLTFEEIANKLEEFLPKKVKTPKKEQAND